MSELVKSSALALGGGVPAGAPGVAAASTGGAPAAAASGVAFAGRSAGIGLPAGAFGSKKPGGFARCATSSRLRAATPASCRPAFSPTRGSLILTAAVCVARSCATAMAESEIAIADAEMRFLMDGFMAMSADHLATATARLRPLIVAASDFMRSASIPFAAAASFSIWLARLVTPSRSARLAPLRSARSIADRTVFARSSVKVLLRTS